MIAPGQRDHPSPRPIWQAGACCIPSGAAGATQFACQPDSSKIRKYWRPINDDDESDHEPGRAALYVECSPRVASPQELRAFGGHAKCCVEESLFREGEKRREDRHRSFLWNNSVNFKKERTLPVNEKQHTTPSPNLGASDPSSSPQDIVHHSFHQVLREKIGGAVRVVIEAVMDEELTLFLGAAWGEYSPERKGSRNGTYTRDLATTAGRIEDLTVRRRSRRGLSSPGV
jgi:hypothetical protein